MIIFTSSSGFSQQWTTVDSTEWESVQVSYYDSLTGNYYLGGRFDTLFGVASHGIIGFDGSNWFPMGSGTNGVVLSIIRFNGDLFIAGVFDSIGITPIRAPIAKWGGTDWVSVDTISHFDDKFLSPNVLPNIQDLCEFGGKLYLSGDFWGLPNSQNSIGYADLARFNGSFIESFMFPWAHPNCGSCKIEVFNNELYIGKSSGTEDTCIGISKSLPDGLLKIDTTCGHFIQIGQWPVTDLNEMYSTDSLLYIGLNFPSSSIGYYVTAFDGVNFNQVGDGINGPVGYLKPYQGKLLAAGYFTGNYSNTSSFKTFSVWDGGNWQSIGSQCDLNYGFQYIAVLDTFIIASGFFDSCGVNPVGSIVMFPGSINTGVNSSLEPSFEPKVIIENGIIKVESISLFKPDEYKLILYDNLGRQVSNKSCCEIKLSNLSLAPGIYFLNVISTTSYRSKCFKIALNFY
jgi:hypothetical protein